MENGNIKKKEQHIPKLPSRFHIKKGKSKIIINIRCLLITLLSEENKQCF